MSELARPKNGLATQLRALTPARVGLGRTGVSLKTREVLDFQHAHACRGKRPQLRSQTVLRTRQLAHAVNSLSGWLASAVSRRKFSPASHASNSGAAFNPS